MPAISTLVMVGMGLAGAALSSSAQKKAQKSQAQAQEKANQQNIQAHTMTPEEKAQYFSSGMTKINQGYDTSSKMAGRSLAARGLGGDATAKPLAGIGRGRAASIGDLWGNLTQTAMNMKSKTPTLQTADAGPSATSGFFGNIGNLMGNVGAYGGAKTFEKKYLS